MTATVAPSRLRALSGAIDQVFSSTSNGLVVFAVAVVASPEVFGQITILTTFLLAVLACLRGSLGIPLLLTANQSAEDVRREGSRALAAALTVSPLLSIAMLIFTPQVGFAAVSLAISAPLVLGQDVLRYVSLAIGRPQVAALWDGIWCLGTLLALVCSWLGFTFVTTGSVLAWWGFMALIAFVAMSVDLRLLPSMRGFITWIKPGWQHRVRYAADMGLDQIGFLLVLAIVATILSPRATGALQGAIVLLAPIGIIGAAVQLVLIPESVRRSAPPHQVWPILTRLGILTAFVTAADGLVFYVLPSSIGSYLLGDSFEPAQRVLPFITAQFIAACALGTLTIFLRTFNRSSEALWLKIAYMITTLFATIVSSLLIRSATGVALGLAVASAAVALVALIRLSPRQRQMPTDRPVDDVLTLEDPPPSVGLPITTRPLTPGDVPSGRAKPEQVDRRVICRKFASPVDHAALAHHDKKFLDLGSRRLIVVAAAATIFSAGLCIAIRGLRLRSAEPAKL